MGDKTVELVFIGHLTLDDTVLPSGKTNYDSLGGAALYSVAGANLWSNNTGLVSRVGYDYSSSNLSLLKSFGIDTTGITCHDQPNIHIWALYDRHSHRYFIPQKEGSNYIDMAPIPSEIPMKYLQSAKGFHIAPMPLPCQETVVETLSLLQGIITVDPHHEWLEPQYRERWKRLLEYVDIFLPSEDEFITFWGISKETNPERYKEWMKKTAALGPSIIALKLGEKGVILYSSGEDTFYHVPSAAENVVDVTGGGDAFCGGFLSGYVQSSDVMTAALYGTISSSFVIEDFGPLHMFHIEEQQVQDRLSKLKVKNFI